MTTTKSLDPPEASDTKFLVASTRLIIIDIKDQSLKFIQVILGREPTRKELFRACFPKDGITQNEKAANAIEQMDELTSQLSEHELDEPEPQDISSKVMGNDKNGTVEMYGLDVCASDVWGVVLSRSARRRDKLQSSDNDSYGINVPRTSPHGLIVANEPQPLRVGLKVYLKSISNSEIVAKGWIRSLDPDEVVGSEEIVPNWCQFKMLLVHVLLGLALLFRWCVRTIDDGRWMMT
ncbi:hypothetical protein Tco_1246011 [Tanacetum coccineum]